MALIGIYSEKQASIAGTSIWALADGSGEVECSAVIESGHDNCAWDDKVIHGPVERFVREGQRGCQIHQPTTQDLVSTLRVYREANEAVGGRRDLIDMIWTVETELAHRPVRERMDAGYEK